MNQKNYEYLRDQLKYSGFGEDLAASLKAQMQENKAEFELLHNTEFGEDKVAAVLAFRKSEQQDRYFFNKYLVAVRPANPLLIAEQTFYINKGSNVTLKEAYNLLRGRAVEKELTSKEGMVYKAWLQLDFRQREPSGNYKVQQFHQNYGFDLEKALASYPIKELEEEGKRDRLLDSLRRGNLQVVTLKAQDGQEIRHFVEASPQFKSVNVYNERMLRLRPPGVAGEQAVREGAGERLREQAGQRRGQRRGKSIS